MDKITSYARRRLLKVAEGFHRTVAMHCTERRDGTMMIMIKQFWWLSS